MSIIDFTLAAATETAIPAATPVKGYAHIWLQEGLYAFADETGELHGGHPTIDDAVAAMQRYAASL